MFVNNKWKHSDISSSFWFCYLSMVPISTKILNNYLSVDFYEVGRNYHFVKKKSYLSHRSEFLGFFFPFFRLRLDKDNKRRKQRGTELFVIILTRATCSRQNLRSRLDSRAFVHWIFMSKHLKLIWRRDGGCVCVCVAWSPLRLISSSNILCTFVLILRGCPWILAVRTIRVSVTY